MPDTQSREPQGSAWRRDNVATANNHRSSTFWSQEMPFYTVQMTWLHSVETLDLDTNALPEPGSFVTTSESWSGEADLHQYHAEVIEFSQGDKSISLKLRYEQAHNPDMVNDSWGISTIALDLTKSEPRGKAEWRDDNIGAYNGSASKVTVTKRATVAETAEDELMSDLGDIERSAPETEKLTQILARIGQGRFRADVTRAWKLGEVCAVTGIDVPELLIASHILPWSESGDKQRIDPANGLLLATHVDKLFDRHLLSFRESDSDYFIAFNPRIGQVADKLGIKADARLPVERLSEAARVRFAEYMGHHFKRFNERLEEWPAPTLG